MRIECARIEAVTRSQEKGAAFESIVIAIPPARIVEFKAIIESYDNLATLRTEDPRRHHLRLYFASDQKDTVNQLIESLRERFEIRPVV
jgi:Domain of unknown function (DUF4911)